MADPEATGLRSLECRDVFTRERNITHGLDSLKSDSVEAI
jgi:hypothetical protein